MRPPLCRLGVSLLACGVAVACGHGPQNRPSRPDVSSVSSLVADSGFARIVERVSEAGGFFDTDNLISNERSYLHVLGALESLDVRGGVYIGVGPDQNFSYIADIRPDLAFIVDIRADNRLQHLMFKTLFEAARTRVDYLALMVGAPPPGDLDTWSGASIEDIVAYLDSVPRDSNHVQASRHVVMSALPDVGWPMSAEDAETVGRFHDEFMRAQLDLRFRSHNRSPRPYYPTLRTLILERDLTGRRRSYLADEEDFQFLKRLAHEDRIVPVVGDLAGAHAVREIGRLVAARGGVVSALYASNVEYYLWRSGTFDRFADNVASLPIDDRSVIIRSYFGGMFGAHAQAVPGFFSTQLVQTLASFVDDVTRDGYRGYWDLVTRHAVPLQ